MSEGGRSFTLRETHNSEGKLIFIDNSIVTSKYTAWNFVFLNLYEQFSRIANFYFLVIVILMAFDIAPISASVAALPLIIVVVISMLREGIEDILRHRSDNAINASPCQKLSKDGKWETAEWRNTYVGDIIKVTCNEQIPADMILLSTPEEDGIVYIDTCNLDGESNLKVKQALKATAKLTSEEQLNNIEAKILCDEPNNMLYTFNGCIDFGGQQVSVDNNQVLLRGCTLRNTSEVYGAVVYTGLQSKLMMNSSAARSKRSYIERALNKKLYSVFGFLGFLALFGATYGTVFHHKHIHNGDYWYMFLNENNDKSTAAKFFLLLACHIIIINAMIPISLYVTLEVVRVFQALFVKYDAEMYDMDTKTFANARTSNISDDLGQIKYIFSDKTGTLTRNVMEFMKCSINGEMYGSGITEIAIAAAKRQGIILPPQKKGGKAFHDEKFDELLHSENAPQEFKDFLWLLSICHSVIPEKDETKPHGIAFQASSPDEGALVEAAADLGYVFTNRTSTTVTVNVNDKEYVVDILANLEFTSDRKRSSVVIKHPETGKLILFCKGADDLICQRLSPDCKLEEVTKNHLKQFAADGLRTLCLAYKNLDEAEFNAWKKEYDEASCLIDAREEKVAEVCNKLETNLMLLGATAIEDKLQEGVPDTIESLLKAGINVWVITGDKRETAINIGFACALVTSEMHLTVLDTTDEEELLRIMNETISSNYEKIALVASGQSLYHLLSDNLCQTFFELTQRCNSVICCRVSPLQKASIVKLMRERTGEITLAVGDGANDVGMILQADVGIGISGREGRQAVLSSDYSIGQFRFLKKLLLVHGRLSLLRNIELINYSFYKNMACSACQILFGFFSGFSGNTMFDGTLYSIFNVFFTSAPPVVLAGIERDTRIETMMEEPELYDCDGKKKEIQSYWRYWQWLLLGIYHAIVAFFISYFMLNPSHSTLIEHQFIVYASIVCLVNFVISMATSYWTWLNWFFYFGSILIYPLCAIIIDALSISNDMHRRVGVMLGHPEFYFACTASVIIGLFPIIILHTIKNAMNTPTNKIRYYEHNKKHIRIEDSEEGMTPESQKKEEEENKGEEELQTIKETTQEDNKGKPLLPVREKIVGIIKKGNFLKYPDPDNETGYDFDPPVNLGSFRRDRLHAMTIDPNEQVRNALGGVMRSQTVSKFALDDL